MQLEEFSEEFKKFVKKHKKNTYCISAHHNADPDAVASALIIYEYLKQQNIKNITLAFKTLNTKSKELLEKYGYKFEKIKEKNCDAVILVDTANKEQIDTLLNYKYLIVIDHHKHNNLQKESSLAYVNNTYLSCALLTYEIINNISNTTKSQKEYAIAGTLYDTAFLKYSDLPTLEKLTELFRKTNKSPRDFIYLYKETLELPKELTVKMLSRLIVKKYNNLNLAYTTIGTHESYAASMLYNLGFDIATAINVSKKEVRVSIRYDKKIKINYVAVVDMLKNKLNLSCGGHEGIISCNGNVQKTKEDIIQEIHKIIINNLR